ncbi:MAG TPA: hypothetical protein PLX50_08540, partial [Candidatus Aminicenantes bacterium]|nr:hypothetical protein [Candidatus Aminicenantes bacterium]
KMKAKKGKRFMAGTWTALALWVLLPGVAPAQSAKPSPQTFNTAVYFDYRHFLSNDGPATLKPADPSKAYVNNAFAFRRAYFTYENKLGDNLKFRFRLDADNTANVTGVAVDFNGLKTSASTDSKLRPFMKHLYLEYADVLVPRLVLNVGMIETLTFKPAEDRWGLRSVAKTLVDGYRDITGRDILSTSADLGATLKYSVSKHFRLAAGVYNGAAYSKAENDQFKELQLQAQVTPVPGLSFVGYYDYERKLPNPVSFPSETSPAARTFKLDGFFEMVKDLVVGVEWFTFEHDLYRLKGKKFDVSGLSVFGRYTVTPGKLALYCRWDGYRPNSLDRDLDASLVIAGLDWAPLDQSWRLQPNVWFRGYKNGARYVAGAEDRDLVFNLTFFLSF